MPDVVVVSPYLIVVATAVSVRDLFPLRKFKVIALTVVAPTESVTVIVSNRVPSGINWVIVNFAVPAVAVSHVIPGANEPVTFAFKGPVPNVKAHTVIDPVSKVVLITEFPVITARESTVIDIR